MEKQNQNKPETRTSVGSNFLDFLLTILKYKKFLIIFIGLISIGSVVTALITPKWYKSTASVLPAEQNDLLSSLSGGIGSIVKNFSPSKGLASLAGNDETDRYIAILKSSSVIDQVIKKFDLVKVYEREGDYHEKTVKDLIGNLEIEKQDEGNLTVTIYDKDPKRAAQLANYFIDLLNEISTRLHSQNASASKQFIEKRYLQNVNDIATAEAGMKSFQEKYGVISVPDQVKATISTFSTIYGELAKKEVEYNILKKSLPEDHPKLDEAKLQYFELSKKVKDLSEGNAGKDFQLLIPFKDAPSLGGEFLKMFRNLEIQYKILEFITPLYEQAKVEEVRNTPSVIVLDKATPAERKAKPKISLYGFIGFLSSLLVGICIVFTKEMFLKFEKSEPQRYQDFINLLRFK